MRYKYSLSIFFTTWLVIACLVKAVGQPVGNTFYCAGQMGRIGAALKDTAHVSFQVIAVTTFNDATTNTVTGQYKVSGNKVHLVCSDSTEFIQNSLVSLTVRHNLQRAVLSKPLELFTYVLHVSLTDPSFYKTFVTGMAVTDTGGYKKLSYLFKPASPFRGYEILYDSTTYRMQAIQYSFNIAGSGATPAGSKMPFQVTMRFSNYQTGLFTDNVFSTDGYFIRKKGVCNMVPPYTSYQIKNSLNQ
jgi:hypothetical protein